MQLLGCVLEPIRGVRLEVKVLLLSLLRPFHAGVDFCSGSLPEKQGRGGNPNEKC